MNRAKMDKNYIWGRIEPLFWEQLGIVWNDLGPVLKDFREDVCAASACMVVSAFYASKDFSQHAEVVAKIFHDQILSFKENEELIDYLKLERIYLEYLDKVKESEFRSNFIRMRKLICEELERKSSLQYKDIDMLLTRVWRPVLSADLFDVETFEDDETITIRPNEVEAVCCACGKHVSLLPEYVDSALMKCPRCGSFSKMCTVDDFANRTKSGRRIDYGCVILLIFLLSLVFACIYFFVYSNK